MEGNEEFNYSLGFWESKLQMKFYKIFIYLNEYEWLFCTGKTEKKINIVTLKATIFTKESLCIIICNQSSDPLRKGAH